MKNLHTNSLGIPREELPGFFGSPTVAKEFMAEAQPAIKKKRCVLYDRSEATKWWAYRIAKERSR
jgi:hypothetical protein